MNGRYIVYTPIDSARNEKRFDAAWRRFAELCRSLDRDGLNYSVTLNLADVKPHVLITASGKASPRKRSVTRARTLPMPIPADRCKDRAQEAEWFLPENRERRKDGTAYWAKHKGRYEELAGMAEEFIRADAEYWRELETLSGQRQHFKPGLSDDTRNYDDGVAA